MHSPPDSFIHAIFSAKRIVAVSHVKPDGDAFGSTLGLMHSLTAAGRSAIVVGLTPVPKTYQFMVAAASLPPSTNTIGGKDAAATFIPASEYMPAEGDLIVVCDCGALDRIPEALQNKITSLPSACIDHHKTNSGFTTISYIDAKASSTSEMMYRVIVTAGLPVNRAVAEALWVGIITDTGRFAYDSVTGDTLRCAADLLERGKINTSFINDQVYGNIPESRLRLQARAINSLERIAEGRIAIISLSQEDYDACHATNIDSENFVDFARFLEGVQIAVFCYAGEQGKVTRISMRTLPPYDASEFCLKFGGGGHARASGATLHEPLPTSRDTVLKALMAWI